MSLGRALVHEGRHLHRRHPRPGEPAGDRVPAGRCRLLPRRGCARRLAQHPRVHRRPARGQRRAVLERRDPSGQCSRHRGRLRPLRRHRPGEPGDPGPELRRQDAGRIARPRSRPGAARELLPQRLRLAGRPSRLPRRCRQHASSPTSTSTTSPTRRNPEFINDFDLVTLRGVRPDRQRVGAQQERLQPRHGRQADRRPDGDDGQRTGTAATSSSTSPIPLNPTHITDTNFDDPDPLTGFDPPEGNAHQGEFSARQPVPSHRRRGLRSGSRRPGRDRPPDRTPASIPAARSVAARRSRSSRMACCNGPTYYGGYGCPTSAPVPDRATINPTLEPGEEAILVLQRGPASARPARADDPEAPEESCFPGEKAQTASRRGLGRRPAGQPP